MTDGVVKKTTFTGGDGAFLIGDVCGPPNASTCILLHGGGQNRSSWRKAALRLGAASYRTCAVDLRGHGESDWSSEGDYRIDRFVDDLTSVIEQVGEPATLIGASFGGHVALLTAARRPTLVHALILCDVTPWIEGEATRAMRRIMCDAANGFASVEDAARHLELIDASPQKDTSRLIRHLRVGNGDRLFWHWDPRFFIGQEEESSALTAKLASAAYAVRAPTLMIRGERSKIVTPEQLLRLRAAIPNAQFAELAGASHTVTAKDNDGYAAIMLNFLASQQTANGPPRPEP